jgi:Ca2+-binding RTX toxin-like protein
MSLYDDALALSTGGAWLTYLDSDLADHPLGYTFDSTFNPIPTYYYVGGNPANGYVTDYTNYVTTGDEESVQPGQTSLIRYFLSDTTGVTFRDSFSDVTHLQLQEQNYPSATGEVFIMNTDLNTDADGNVPDGRGTIPTTDTIGTGFAGDVWLSDSTSDTTSLMQSQLAPGQQGALIILHELAHAIGGLQHPSDAGITEDNQQYTIMSDIPSGWYVGTDTFLHAGTNALYYDSDTPLYAYGLQLLDIAAIQSAYQSRNYSERSDNTLYDLGNGLGWSTDTSKAFIYTIWDGGGTDVIDATGFGGAVKIDLRQGDFSSIGSNGNGANGFDPGAGRDIDNVAIAFHTVIENAIGTSYDDTLVGNDWNNVLYGAGGDDQIYGSGVPYDGQTGFKTVDSSDSSDPNSSVPSMQEDVLIGGAGNDILYGGVGNNVLDGGYNKSDIDTATSSWSTYWDSAGQFTDNGNATGVSNNKSGVPLSDITVSSDGTDTADYSHLPLGTSYTGIDVTFSNSVDYGTVSKGASGALGTDTLLSIETVIGTAQNDTFNHANGESQTFFGGAGSDGYHFSAGDVGTVSIVESYDKGIDTLYLDPSFTAAYIYAPDAHDGSTVVGVTMDLFYGTSELLLDFTTSDIADGYGIEFIKIGSDLIPANEIQPWLESFSDTNTAYSVSLSDLAGDIQSWESSTFWTGGTGGAGAGGSVLPSYDGLGNVTSMEIDPAIGGSPISSGIADVVDNPLVLTSFSESYSGSTYTSTTSWATYEQAFDFVSGVTPSDVRLTLSGSQGFGALTISIDSLDFSLTLSDFETGKTISGIEVYNSTLHGLIEDASGATLTSTGTNTFGGSYLTLTGLDVDTSASVTEHYFLEALNFAGGDSIDLTAPITFIGTDSGETLTGLDGRADTIYGMGGDDTIYGYGGNDTLIGGAGDDQLYGGTGDDTYVFAAGWGNDTVHENTGEGNDTLHFTGIAPSDIRMYTDAYGDLHLVQISDPSNSVTVNAGVTGSGDSESAVGSYVENVTFDSSYSTTWDLTGGLNLTGDNSGDYLYGTAYGDTITGGTGADVIYGNGGNDTIIGGSGDDYLYGGTGNDTYVFSSGFGNATVHENLSEGTDTIRFTGIDPADIRLWTDAYGYLHLQDTADTAHNITVIAGTTGSGDSESTIGSYVESVTFDSSYSTTWDLTGGLHITGDNSGDYLYGTAYNDTITGGTGDDVIYGNGGDDTIIGGAGDDYLYGGTGNDTYVFSSGFGNSTVHENTGEGTDTIRFTGIDPADIRLWTDAYGYLHLQDTADTAHNITVIAGTTGSGDSESTIGSYVESVTFDSSYSTTWDLTGGLHITGDNSGDYLYGTAYNDTITGGTGDDVIYGNGGNDTIIGGAGDDYLYGGTGNDTYVFSSGFGNATVHENLSEGTDTIRFTGIDPADIRLWTDAYGYLHLQDTSDTSHNITVIAGVTGDNNAESTIGSYVESVTFDSSYSTTWDLTGGLNITGDNSGDYLYGTAYGDTITGGTGADNLYGNAGNDVLYGAGGNDQLTGGPGADTFLFKAATAETGVATIMDFNTTDGDKIDLADVISTYDPLTMAIANFVQLATSGSDTQVKVDTDGSGTSYTQIATIQGVTGLNLADLITDGNLIVHHT